MIFEGIPGVKTLMDDIIAWRSIKDEDDAQLRQVLDVTQYVNLKLSKEICVKTLTFIGDVILEEGVTPDPRKMSAIENMEKSQNKEEAANLLFDINQSTEDLIVTKPLDRETTDGYILRVHANNSAWDVNTDVTIFVTDINDNAPQFIEPFYNKTIPEPTVKEMFVLNVSVTDRDLDYNGSILYFLEQQNEFLQINATTGEIFTKEFISLQNTLKTALTTTKLSLLYASLTSSITAGNNGRYFTIGNCTGLLTLARTLDFEMDSVYSLQINGQDGGWISKTASAKVVIHVQDANDTPAEFCENACLSTIAENSPWGTTVLKLNATDNDTGIHAEINYTIEDGNTELFFIRPQTGIITLSNRSSMTGNLKNF
ncbi:protocadherin Fat 4-like [Hypanus sabinus]|uniref:protocadherin Fat 4-like n=1 Tax=Hypanus sabinus TaxID=79690 RepID=UPI0028C44D3C|nr:protocadherin Fat 4-like [Hypanus sabinus]